MLAKGVLFSKRVNNEQIVASFVKDDKVIPCCGNACCAKLLGSHAEFFSACPGPEESMQRLAVVNAVVATRTHIHDKGQLESGDYSHGFGLQRIRHRCNCHEK